MIKLVLAGALAVPVAAAGTVAATGVVVVDVRDARANRHLVIPVPLAVAQAAAAFVPTNKAHVRIPEKAKRHLPMAVAALKALEAADDAELVRVEEPGETVSIRKEGGLIRVHVQGRRGEDVNVQVPIGVALYVLESGGEDFTPSDAVWALKGARLTQLVDVQEPDGTRVKVTVY
jgi:hypothetical protein